MVASCRAVGEIQVPSEMEMRIDQNNSLYLIPDKLVWRKTILGHIALILLNYINFLYGCAYFEKDLTNGNILISISAS